MKKIIIALFFLNLSFGCVAQGITFINSTFDEALSEAKKQDKILFVDVYADWCGPCKVLSEQIFTLKEVGEYFNEKFVCCKLNADSPENKTIVEKYKIQGLPTLMFIDTKGELVNTLLGAGDSYVILRAAKIATKEHKDENQLYEMYKKDKANISIQQAILLDAQYFMPNYQGSAQERWWLRIKEIYDGYVKTKGIDNMINQNDYRIITMFHDKMDKKDEVIEFMVKNFEKYKELVDSTLIAQYVTAMHSNLVIELARGGDKEYATIINRMTGDMKPIYSVLFPETDNYLKIYSIIAEANYEIFSKKNTAKYIELMDTFLNLQPKTSSNDYAMIVETIFNAQKGKLSKEGFNKCILWIDDALKGEMNTEMQVGMTMTMGDCFFGLANNTKAKECYNQAYMLSIKSENKQFTEQMRQLLVQKLSTVGE